MSQEFLNLEELAEAHRKLRVEYERTREIVDILVEKLDGHVHELKTVNIAGSVVTTEPTKKEEVKMLEPVERLCQDCQKPLGPNEKVVCDDCIPF